MLVTRSSPGWGVIRLIVPVTCPAAFTDDLVGAGAAAQLLVVLLLEPGLADQVHAGEAGHRDAELLAPHGR